MEAFAARGLAQACVSNGGRMIVDANMRAMSIPHFRFSIAREGRRQRQAPSGALPAGAKMLGLPPEACAVIEDSPTGARSAKAAGMLTIAWPQHPAVVFDTVDHLVEDPAALDWDALCG
ncbi:HAD family hydrolase [Azospirillum sp. INR13]|uniref:HAD-IA family hydrolase n=1 Tax=Azospirillum sp. INR13 TaxID=2596919 RepID=UPI00351C7EE9|nr:HAD family hydrolase [Azospirillum sp. INR13]